MKRIFLFFAIVGIGLGLFLGVRSSVLNNNEIDDVEIVVEEDYNDELSLPLAEVDTLNPILTNNKQVADILKLIYESLFDFDEKDKLVPSLGIDYMEKDDGSWIITLNKDAKWHSEKPFSADDVIFTINSIKSNSTSAYYNNVKNIADVSRIEDNSILISLNNRDVFLPYKLTFPIIPEYYLRDSLNDKDKLIRMIGTGPYMYSNLVDDVIVLKFNSSWWNKKEHRLNTIYLKQYSTYGEAIKAFKSSEVDVISTSMSSWEKKFGIIGINSYRYDSQDFDLIIPNCNRTILKDSSVRRAILYGINRENIIDEVYSKNANKQDLMIHSYSWLNDKEQLIEYNQDKAKQLLTNASWKLSNNVWSKNINNNYYTLRLNLMVCKGSDDKAQAAKKIKENLENIGFRINIVEVDSNTFNSNIEKRNFDLALATLETKNEFDILEMLRDKNYSSYSSEIIDEKLNKLYLSNLNLNSDFKDLQSYYRSELPYIGLYYKTNVLLTNKAVKGNISPTYWNPYHNIYDWTK